VTMTAACLYAAAGALDMHVMMMDTCIA
jgi:hypothetical protein